MLTAVVAVAVALALAETALVVDLARQIPPDNRHFYDTVHLSERGSKLAAES